MQRQIRTQQGQSESQHTVLAANLRALSTQSLEAHVSHADALSIS